MSLGYLDDEENQPIEGPPVPGSADEFIAGVNAQPLAAPISPEIPDESAFPPPVPPEAPGMVPPPTPTTAVAAPGSAIAPAPAPNVPPAPPLGSIADVSQAGGKAIASRRKADEAQLGVLQAGEPQGAEVAALAQEKADNARLEQADIEEKAQASAAAEAQATKIYDQAAAAKRNFQFHDYWSDKSTARRVGSALAVAFGAYGAAMTHTQNYALEILNKSMDDDHRNQVDQFQKLTDAEAQARTGIADAHAAKIQGLTDIGTKWAAANRSIAATAEAVAAKTADAEGKAKLLAFAQDLNAKADETEYTTKQGIYKSILANQAAGLKNAEITAHTNLMNAQTAAGGFARGRGRAGSGGGGGGAALGTAAGQLTKQIEDAKAAGTPLSQGQIIDAANGLKIPLEAKAGHVSLKTILAGIGTGAKQGIADRKADLGDQRQLAKEATEWSKTNGIPALIKKQDELSAVLEEVKNAPHNPLQQALAVEKAVSSARGGAASRQALDLALHHLGGKWDSIESFVQGARNGELGQKQMDNFIGFMTNQLGTAQAEGKKKYDEFNKFVESQPGQRRDEILASRGRIFSGLHGFGGQATGGGSPAIPQGAKIGTKGGVRGYMLDGKFTAL